MPNKGKPKRLTGQGPNVGLPEALMRPRKTVTKPRQAGSPRILDWWQVEVELAIADAEEGEMAAVLWRLKRLRRSIQRAETR